MSKIAESPLPEYIWTKPEPAEFLSTQSDEEKIAEILNK